MNDATLNDPGLRDGVAIVTGGSRGIGRAVVETLAAAGMHVIFTYRENTGAATQVVNESARGNISAEIVDGRDAAACEALVEKVVEKHGKIDLLVNNAGVIRDNLLAMLSEEDVRTVLETNVIGTFNMTRAVVPHMISKRRGNIVNISSVAGRTARPNIGGYNASKWAVNGFSEALRQEVHMDGIRVTIVEPGVVRTELREHITNARIKQEHEQWASSMTQLESEDIAAAIIYAVTAPERANINEILIRPTEQQG